MADDSSPEPGEAPPPRGRIVQLKGSTRGSMERQSLESGRAGDSPAYSSHSQQWRGSPPRNRLPRPYNNTGYYKRQQPNYEAAGAAPPYQRERVFSRSRGRSVSRSPSRASLQRARSRSRSPSPKSPPRSRSRSRSRSFSPRGHRTFANWERGGRNAGAGQYAAGRGGRGGNFDVRQRRERDSWPRGGGRGGGRFATYQRGNRFYPKEVRYKPQQAPMPRQRSISRDRSSNEGGLPVSGSYRDRQMRDRDPRDYEQAYRGRTRERELSNRSTSLVRTASFASDYYRDSEPSASAEEGEEKPEESYVTTSERSVESHTPSDAGSIERDSTNVVDSSSKRQPAAALPPRPIADSYASSRREARVAREADESAFRSSMRKTEVARDAKANIRLADEVTSPVLKTESTRDARTNNRFADKDVEQQVASGNSPIISSDGDEVKSTANLPQDTESVEGNAFTNPSDRDAATDEVAGKNGDQTGRPRGADEDGNTPEAGLEAVEADNDPAASAEEASTKIEDTTDLSSKTDHDSTQASTNAAAEVLEEAVTRPEAHVNSPQVPVTVESDAQLPEETRVVVGRVLTSPERKRDMDGKSEVPAIAKSDASPSKIEEREHCEEKSDRSESAEQTSPTQDDVDMDVPSRSIPAESAIQAQDVEMETAVASDGKSIIQAETMPANRLRLSSAGEPTSSQLGEQRAHTVVTSTIPPSKPKEVTPVESPEASEVEEGEMVVPSSKDESVKKDFTSTGTSSGKMGEAAASQVSPPQAQNEKRAADSGKYGGAFELGRGREKRAKIERSRTDPSATSYRDNNKPRSTSFSSFGLPSGSQREGNAGDDGKTLFRAETVYAMAPTHEEKRGIPLPKQNEAPSLAEQGSFARIGRPGLDRRASFSTLQDRSSHVPSEARPTAGSMGYTGGSRTARASSSFSKASPPKPYAGLESKPEGQRRALHDEIKKEDAARRELLRAGSMDSMIDRNAQRAVAERAQGIKESSASASNSPNRRNQPREELPALPDIPLPSGIRETQSPTVLGEGTPTKRHRPRLGWGQGLVAPSPPQPAKRPRIGWGQGLMQPKDDITASPSAGGAGTVDSPAKVTETNAAIVVAQGEQQSVDKLEPAVSDPAGSGGSSNKEQATEDRTLVTTPEKEKQTKPVVVEEASAEVATEAVVNEADKDADVVMEEEGDIEQDEASPEPSKEEILSTIDVLDSDIAGVKKQIEALQKTITTADTEQESASVSVNDVSSGNRTSSAKLDTDTTEAAAGDRSVTSPRDSSNVATDEPLMTSPVKLAVDSRFVELLAGVFSENLRKTAAANALLPKRMEQGQLATKIYHQPSDYAFYQANIARGSALADQVRLKVRMRNRARYEHMKKLARDYVELKKSWKTGVKRMEKDRKRQDKLRLKQLQKQKLKSMGESGPIRTTNTNHQSPHVQQLVAAEKAAEAAGSEGGAVRTSSRLTNNSSGDLENNDLEKIEQAKAQALIDQEVRKKRLKNALSTVIPDMLITPVERQQRYFTRFVNGQGSMADGLVTDWKLKEKAEMKVNPWNDLEKCIYVDKFLQFPKNFPRISSFLRNKTTGDVIAFYYRTKKVADYKALLREQQLRRRGAGSKNTWSCWNLSACAAICLGVQFPENVAKLLLHPSNFRSHQASDNILNSAGAQRLLRSSSQKPAGDDSTVSSSAGTSSETTGVLSALELVSGSDHTPSVRPSTPGDAVQLDDIASSGDSDTSDEEKFNLYTQQLEQFIAGQQRPFLVDYAALLSDNSYSTGYEVTTLSIEERLKKYPVPSKELESASAVATGSSATGVSQETSSKGKQQSNSAGSSANAKTSGSHMTKKELKQQRKLKKMQEGAAAAASSASASSQSVGNAGVEKGGNHTRKKSAAGSSTAPNASGSRNGPRISIPGDDKVSQGGKKTSRNGGGTPGSRRNNQHPQANVTNASPKPPAVPSSATAMAAAATLGPAKKSSGGNATTHGNARTSSPSANATVGGNAGGAAPAKRVVQKWTEGEKADFLKYFSQYGKDWATLTENIPTKTAAQIKNYYQNYKNRLNLQDILKRRIENAAASGGAKGGTHSTTPSALSPRSAAAGLMSGTLRQMGRSVDLPAGMSMGMPSGSMAINAADPSMSFQAALNAAQPGMHGVNVMSELSANQFGMQAHPDQQQQSREMMNPASSSERYLKLLNMQHQLQIMQFQQQQKSQGMTADNAGAGGNNSSYHESQINAANAQRLYQYSRQQQQQQVPPQQLSLQALQQMGMQTHAQGPAHSQMMQLPMQQQQARGSFSEMGHPNSMYQSMGQMQPQHPQAMAAAAQMGMSPTSAQRYDANSSGDGGVVQARGNAGGVPSQMGRHSMMNMAMVNNTAGGNGSAAANSPHHPPMGPSRSMAMETSRPPEVESRQTAWRSAPAPTATSVATSASPKLEISTTSAASSGVQDNASKERAALAPPAPPPVQPVRSRMSFSSILNESESPRDDATPRGNGSMVIKQQESPRVSEQQQREQQQREQQQMQQRQQPPLHITMPPSSGELARSPVSAPSPTAHLLPRRSSAPTPHNRMGLMSSLLNVSSPERRTTNPGHQSPLMQQQQQQQLQRQMQAARYYDAATSSAEAGGSASRGSMATMVSGMPASSTMSSTMARSSPSDTMSSSMASYSNTSAQMAVALSRSGSGSSTSSAVSANAASTGDPRAQQQMWNYSPQIRYEEAELLRRAQRAEEEAARAAAAAAAAARALQEAQKARQQALDMAANMARYNSAMQQQQQAQQQQQQAQQQQPQQYQQLQYQQLQAQAHHQQQQQMQVQQHEYHQQHQAQQLHQQQMQHQALHHHLQLMQQQQQRPANVSPSDHLLQQQLHQQQQPPRGPQSGP